MGTVTTRTPAATVPVKQLGTLPYQDCLAAMQQFNNERATDRRDDQLWLVQHPPVYTLGLNGKREHILNAAGIPVVETDRGGQVTYHGPGQQVLYVLLHLKSHQLGVRELVELLENSVIDLLSQFGISARGDRDAPGVYVGEAKIASLGLRVRRGCTYHGVALNLTPDLAPFANINPCGYIGLPVTRLCDHLDTMPAEQDIAQAWTDALRQRLSAASR